VKDPKKKRDVIVAAHGGGGEMTKRLLESRILPGITNPALAPLTDGAVLDLPPGRLVVSTDAHVIRPIEFPGGDIGRLAVCGTVNDVAMMGARPLALALALVLEEGLDLAVLERIMRSVAESAEEAGVSIVTGDTKVVEKGHGDGIYITTTGVGVVAPGVSLDAARIRRGDVLIVNGSIAEHGLAIMAARERLGIQSSLKSDVAPLGGLVQRMLETRADVKFLRDPTRGGIAGVVADLAETTGLTVEVREADVPVSPNARHAAEALGLDPLTVANEGKLVAVVPQGDAERVLAACREFEHGRDAAVIGRLVEAELPLAELVTRIGGRRIIQRPSGAELPRIC